MEIAVFKYFKDGFYSFLFEDGLQMEFEEIHPKALYKYNLNKDDSFVDKTFKLSYSEVPRSRDFDDVIYRIDRLELV